MRRWGNFIPIAALCIALFAIYELFIYLYVLVPWAVPWVGNIIIVAPPKPEITYGEFPISVTFEVNGQTRIIGDTIICEFDGVEFIEGSGKRRKWKSNLKSGNTSLSLLNVEEENLKVEIDIFTWYPEYYMGDFRQSKEEYEKTLTDVREFVCVQSKNGIETCEFITKEEVWEKYKLKVINVQYSPPIENTFK